MWRWYNTREVSFWCANCVNRRYRCSLSVLRIKLQGPPKILPSKTDDDRRAQNRIGKQLSDQKKKTQGTVSSNTRSSTRTVKKPKRIAHESEESSVSEFALSPSPKKTSHLSAVASFHSQSPSHPFTPNFINISSFLDVLSKDGQTAVSIREVVSDVLAARRHEQNLVSGLSQQVQDRDGVYASLLRKLERKARALEQAEGITVDPSVGKEESGGSGNTQQYASSESLGARTSSEPAVAIMLDEIIEDSEDSQVDDSTTEGGQAVESVAEESTAE